jgi:hypothetical protein
MSRGGTPLRVRSHEQEKYLIYMEGWSDGAAHAERTVLIRERSLAEEYQHGFEEGFLARNAAADRAAERLGWKGAR